MWGIRHLHGHSGTQVPEGQEWTYEIKLKASQHPAWDGDRGRCQIKSMTTGQLLHIHEYRYIYTYVYVRMLIFSQPSVMLFRASWAKCGGCLFYNPPWISPPAACPASTWNEGRKGTTKLVKIRALSPACLQFTLTADLLCSLGRAEWKLAGCIEFILYLL